MRKRALPLRTRLLLAQAMVLVAALGTAAAVAALVGPELFHEHMLRTGHTADDPELEHVEAAYRTASLISLGLAMATAVIAALAVSWYVSRRLQRPMVALAQAARAVSGGEYDVVVPTTRAAPELDAVTEAFNAMAGQLAHTEETRRRLLSDLAHELRTPIATISAYLDALEDGIANWGPATSGLLHDQIARLTRLSDDIAAVSRAEEGQLKLDLQPLDVGDLVVSAIPTIAEHCMAKGIRLTIATADVPASVIADRARTLQVLTNLLTNAHRHTPSGGHIDVWWSRRGDSVEIGVSDDGDGITPEHLSHVFERFYRGDAARDRDHGGSGIGLTISRAIARAHGGSLTAHSEGNGRGATFTLTLPGG